MYLIFFLTSKIDEVTVRLIGDSMEFWVPDLSKTHVLVAHLVPISADFVTLNKTLLYTLTLGFRLEQTQLTQTPGRGSYY